MPDPLAGLPPRYLRTPEAARFLGLSGRTLEKHRTYGTGPKYCKIGGRVVYALYDLQDWAELRPKSGNFYTVTRTRATGNRQFRNTRATGNRRFRAHPARRNCIIKQIKLLMIRWRTIQWKSPSWERWALFLLCSRRVPTGVS
jgi:predicted DNA-binding transcriptional regulator AlpA